MTSKSGTSPRSTSSMRETLQRGRWPLRMHLIVLVVGAVLPLLVFTMVLVWRFADTQRADIAAKLRSNAADLAIAVDRQFETAVAALQVLAQSRSLAEDDLRSFYTMAQTVREQRRWGTLVVLDSSGTQVLNLLRPLGAGMPNVGNRPYLREALRTRQPVVSDLYRGSISGQWVVAIAVPVMRANDVRYVLVAIIYAKDLQSLVADEAGWTRALVDRNGIIAARTHVPEYIGRAATADFLQRTAGLARGSYTTTALDGVDRFGAFVRAPLSGWIATVAVPASLVNGALWRSMMTTVLAGATVLALGVLLAALLGRRIANDMTVATAAAEALAAGGSTAVPNSAVAELWRLGAALQESAGLLESREQQRKQAHALEADARREAEAANQAKDHFLAVLSHELRTPLTPVLTGLTLLQRQENLSTRGQEHLAMIRRNIQLESRLIDDLLDVTRIARGKLEFDRRRVELCSIIEQALDVCRSDIEARGLHLGVDYGPRPYVVEADAARLQQVFWNLLKNAIKFTPQGGCVGIRCRLDGEMVCVEVIDSGLGIERSELVRIFDPFAQAERSISRRFGGLGLGLAISKGLVEAHGGTITAVSEGENRGATFTVRLPVLVSGVQSQPKRTAGGASAVVPAARRPLRVLLVEDHGDTAEMTRLVLESAGHQVTTAGDVSTALSIAGHEPFDVLVSDVGLPDGSGVDLMRTLRARGHLLPGIAVSGFGHARDVESTRCAGFAAHLVKPVDPERLLDALETHGAVAPACATSRAEA